MDLFLLIGVTLIAAGIVDYVISKVVFNKRVDALNDEIKPGMSPDERRPIEEKLKTMRMVSQSLTFSAIFLVLAGIFMVGQASL